MEFLRQSLGHHHARVRLVAKGVADTIDEDIQAGIDICAEAHPLERRLQALEAIEQDAPRRYFAFSAKVMGRLRNTVGTTGADHRDQNSKADTEAHLDLQNSKTASSCSSSDIKTTTTPTAAAPKFNGHSAADPPLVYPKRLSDNQRALADRYLAAIAAHERQAILDELEGRLCSELKGMRPLYDEISFLHSLCRAAKKGEFVPNLGLKVRDERRAREQARQRQAMHRQQSLAEAGRRPGSVQSARRHLDAIRKRLRSSSRPDGGDEPR